MKRLLTGAAMFAVILAVYLLRVDDVSGLYKDDAYYIVLAKALASGQGYALISSALTPILPAFPPGFPLLLAPLFVVAPSYPDNLLWLKAVSILAMLGAAGFTYRYFAVCRGVEQGRAATIAALTALTPGFVFLATSTVMADGLFTFALVASAVALERAARADSTSLRSAIVVAALTTTAAWLVRSAGIALVVGGAVFLLRRRRWRASAAFLAVCALAYAPWTIYAAMHNPSAAERHAHGGSVAYAYLDLVQTQSGGDVASGRAGVMELPQRVVQNLRNVFGHELGAVIFPQGYRGAAESGLEVFMLSGETGLKAGSMGRGAGVVAISLGVSVIALVGYFMLSRRELGVAEYFCVLTVAMVLLLPVRTYRYVLPLAPFLLGYFLTGIETVAQRLRAGSGCSAVRIVASCLLVLLAAEHVQYLSRKYHGPTPPWIEDGREVRAVTDFVNSHLPPAATVVSTNPGLLYLTTGRKAVVYIDPDERWAQWKAEGIRYVVALHAVPEPSPTLGYSVVYESPRLGLWVLEMAPGQP